MTRQTCHGFTRNAHVHPTMRGILNRFAGEANPPCSVCHAEADMQCAACCCWVCREHSFTCVECGEALCAADAMAFEFKGVTEHFSRRCAAAYFAGKRARKLARKVA